MRAFNEIQIDVNGLTGTGKSHVMSTIKKALEAEYGFNTKVISWDLDEELHLNDLHDLTVPNTNTTIFILNEGRVADYRLLKGLK